MFRKLNSIEYTIVEINWSGHRLVNTLKWVMVYRCFQEFFLNNSMSFKSSSSLRNPLATILPFWSIRTLVWDGFNTKIFYHFTFPSFNSLTWGHVIPSFWMAAFQASTFHPMKRQNLESAILCIFINLHNVRIFPSAWTTPACPEVDQHYLSSVGRQNQLFTCRWCKFDFRRFTSGGNFLQITHQGLVVLNIFIFGELFG